MYALQLIHLSRVRLVTTLQIHISPTPCSQPRVFVGCGKPLVNHKMDQCTHESGDGFGWLCLSKKRHRITKQLKPRVARHVVFAPQDSEQQSLSANANAFKKLYVRGCLSASSPFHPCGAKGLPASAGRAPTDERTTKPQKTAEGILAMDWRERLHRNCRVIPLTD